LPLLSQKSNLSLSLFFPYFFNAKEDQTKKLDIF